MADNNIIYYHIITSTMGRFRIFNQNPAVSSSDLNQRIKGNEMMRYLREKDPEKLEQSS